MRIIIRDIFNDTDAVEQLQALFESCSDHFQIHGASLVWAGEETLLCIQMDPYRRIFCIFCDENPELIGGMEVRLSHPSDDCLSFGWFLIRHNWRGMGIGTEAVQEIERRAVREWHVVSMECGVTEHENRARNFLVKNGFKETISNTTNKMLVGSGNARASPSIRLTN